VMTARQPLSQSHAFEFGFGVVVPDGAARPWVLVEVTGA